MNLLSTDAAGAPTRWLICFARCSGLWWVDLIPGTYKHVRAFAYTAETDCYVFYDPCLRTTMVTARGAGARHLMEAWARNAAILTMTPLSAQRLRLSPFSCVTAIASLLGLPGGALRPDGLYRQCLRHGARIVDHEKPGPAATDYPDRPAA
jgi:hypothetical protein